jgi:hypothetical protein
MRNLTLEQLKAGQRLKSALAIAERVLGVDSTWGIIDANLDMSQSNIVGEILQNHISQLENNQANRGDYDTN